MLPEQQQRILGYFIEEARDHLNTIEQGLLNLQSTLNDPEMINEVFRAAHSIKGGAAMLSLTSIQHTSHRLEDCFKVLKENPIQVDQKLESLFLGVSDTLKALLENLSGPFGLSEETANTLMSETEPVFQWLNEHLEFLVQQSNSPAPSDIPTQEIHPESIARENDNTITQVLHPRDFLAAEEVVQKTAPEPSPAPVSPENQSEDNWDEFQTQVIQTLREMLQLFKQKTTPETRHNLQECCYQLVKVGKALNLANWCNLCETTANVIANPQNSYLTLAKIVITEIKKAQELVLQGAEPEIKISQQLTALLRLPEIESLAIEQATVVQPILFTETLETETAPPVQSARIDDFVVAPENTITSLFDLSQELNSESDLPVVRDNFAETSLFLNSLSSDQNDAPAAPSNIDSNGPEVGIAELNTLANLFEGESSELDETWQQQENLDITLIQEFGVDVSSDTADSDRDLADFLIFDDEEKSEHQAATTDSTTDLSLLFGDHFLEKQNQENLQPELATTLELSKIPILDPDLDASRDEVLREFSETSHNTWQPPVEIDSQDVVSDLLNLKIDLDNEQSLSPEQKTDNHPNIELPTKESNSFDELFLAHTELNIVEEIHPSQNLPLNLDLSPSETLSLENLFAEIKDNTSLSIDASETTDLFATLPPRSTDFSQTIDDISNFWQEELTTEQQQELDLNVEDDLAKELEEGLFTASKPSFELAESDFEITFSLGEQQVDLIFTSDEEDNLFADLTPSNSPIYPAVNHEPVSSTAEFLQTGNAPNTQTPETLDFIPEFTSQSTEPELSGASDSFSEMEFDLFPDIDTNSQENSPILFEEREFDTSTYIQQEISDYAVDNLLAGETSVENIRFNENTEFQEFANNLDIFNSELDSSLANLIEVNQENAVAMTVESEVVSPQTTEVEIPTANHTYLESEFAELEALLEELPAISPETLIQEQDFAALEALLSGENDQETTVVSPPTYKEELKSAQTGNNVNQGAESLDIGDEFSDLEKLLAEADQTISHTPTAKSNNNKIPRSSKRRTGRFEETMKIPVKQLDEMSNLVGELVVNRNTLEQDHERLRQSLDNLLIQVQQLSDVGARMQELYERSLLEASLLASRKNKDLGLSSPDANTDRGFSELEMDRFTPFHSLSQEMIEMIVRVRESASDIDFVTEETERVARQFRQVTTQLQEGITKARMVPFSQAIDRLRRGVRDNAIKCGKQVELVISGGETLIDKMILDHLTDPLTHMLNNAIAHGIETPEVRVAAGKPASGQITIRAFHQGNQTVISVADDGAGIDPGRVKAKALKQGIITPSTAQTMTNVDVYDLLFQSGFSMKDQADEISGRGVGMDIVRSEISEVRGGVSTDSVLGKGTTFTIRLPLTLSICKALCCVSDKARIAFPMDGVEDTLDIPVKNIQHHADGQSFISWRDTILPFRPLKDLLTFNRHITRGNVYGGNRDDDMVSVVVVRSGNNLIALQIDLVLSEQEIVIKQFEGPAPKPIGVAGATVLGDGRIMPIADVLEIMDIFQGRMSRHTNSSSWQQKQTPIDTPSVKIDPTVLIVDDSITVRELLSLTFNKAGYRVEQARDGQEAWDKLRSGLPCDIVFCDIEMPRCDGLELLSRIQKDSNLNHLPIAMLTSRGADKHRQMAIQLGASGYFTKPYLEEALLEAAVRMLKGEKLV